MKPTAALPTEDQTIVADGLRKRSILEGSEPQVHQVITLAGEALRVSEARNRTLFELGPMAVYCCDADGVIQEYNGHAAELWGRNPVPGDADQKFSGALKLLRADGSVMPHAESPIADVLRGKIAAVCDAEVVIERPDGTRVNVIVNIRPQKNERGEITGAYNCFYDVSARKQSEAALRLASTAMEAAANAIFITGRDGVIQYINPAFTALCGYNASEAIGQKACLVRSGAHEQSFYHELWQTILVGKVWRGQTTNRHKDGSLYVAEQTIAPVKESGGEITHFVSVQQNITQQKMAEDQMHLSEIRYRRLFEAAHDGVLLLDPESCKIADANPFMTTFLGYPRDHLVGKELFEIGLLKDETASREMFEKLKREHEVRYDDLPLESKNGSHQEVEVVANVYDEGGQAVIQCNIRDITARKLVEVAQRRAEVLAASNQKLELEIIHRHNVENALRTSQATANELLENSRQMQEQLRLLSYQALQAQEEERKRISRELHDVIAQTLTGINIRLALLQSEISAAPQDLHEKIALTQRLVTQSVDTVHRFARDLRPAMLDDLGLIPALQAYLKDFTQQTGIQVKLTADAGVEALGSSGRTVLYRVTQEALTNVVRHAKATHVAMRLQQTNGVYRMEITDNGQGFATDGMAAANKSGRLGLLGMRERVEMIGGKFSAESVPGNHTTILVEIPTATNDARTATSNIHTPTSFYEHDHHPAG